MTLPGIESSPRVQADAVLQQRTVAALARSLSRTFGPAEVRTLETHISHVLVAGENAYKIKKPLLLPFVDYSTLALRRHFCEEELRLNRRLAPELYRDVVAITGTPEAPHVGGAGPVLEYAVRMRAFPPGALLSELLARGELPPARIDELARVVAAFHASAPRVPEASPFGTPAGALADALENFDEIATEVDPALRGRCAALKAWTLAAYARCAGAMAQRRREGRVRECHGDLHLRNAALVDGRVTLFDCIEFNPQLRWIDVAGEAAFAAMDLADRGRADYAWRFLNAWIEATGDHGSVAVLRFHLVYRAMVRAKVRYLRAAQLADAAERDRVRADAQSYLALAGRLADDVQPAIVVMHAPSGAGKSTLAQALLERLPAMRLRTDVERRRLHGIAANAPSGSMPDGGVYDAAATQRTYAWLAGRARDIVHAGYTALLDGAFLRRWQRQCMHAIARDAGAPFILVEVATPVELLRQRVAQRAREGGDPSEATLEVLERQLAEREPLAADEQAHALAWDGTLVSDDPRFAAGVDALARLCRTPLRP